METILSQIMNYGVGFVLISIVLFFVIKYISMQILKQDFKENRINLSTHPLFSDMDNLIIKLDNLEIKNIAKKEMVIDFLKIKIKTFKQEFYDLVSCNSFDKFSESELAKIINASFFNGIKRYEEEARNNNIPELFIRKFNQWHEETINATNNKINNIIYGQRYYDNYTKVCVVLEILDGAFCSTIKDGKITIDNINGDLDDVVYKDKRIGDFKIKNTHLG